MNGKFNRQAAAGALIICLLAASALLAPLLTDYDPYKVNAKRGLEAPGREHLFGTDRIGRDLFSRVLYGARSSLTVGVSAMLLSVLAGTALGAMAGYYGGLADMCIMRIADLILVFPTFFLVIALAALFDAQLWLVVVIIGATGWPRIARLARAEAIRLLRSDYVLCARLLGASDFWIISRHLLPNSLGPILVSATLGVPSAIMAEAGLGYFGLGAKPPVPTWGNMLREAQLYIRQAWWYAFFPGIAIFITVLAFNLLGEGLREIIDLHGNKKHDS